MNRSANQKKVLQMLIRLARETRCCSQDGAFCAGITFHQFIVLDAIVKKREIHLSDLHEILSVEKSTTTRLVNPLIKKGFLSRQKAEHDSRAVKLILTKKGVDIHEKVSSCLAGFLQSIVKNIPEAQLDNVLGSVEIFSRAIRGAIGESRCAINSRMRIKR
ncbi:MAG TPA: MarR family transcriptional regulator [Syntrophales bacterium]|nr:MarR family transcriptional regulator [Syntrophales bacterium]